MGSHYKGTREELRALDAYIALSRSLLTIDVLINSALTAHNLTERQFAVLEALFHLGPLHQLEIAKKMLCTRGNLTGILTTLEKRDLIRRKARVEDRRYIEVSLTRSGTELVERIMPEHVKRVVAAFKPLNASEQSQLRQLAKKLGTRGTTTR